MGQTIPGSTRSLGSSHCPVPRPVSFTNLDGVHLHPLEVSEATNWLRSNGGLKGNALNNALQQQNCDPSVKSLVSFPPVLEMIGSQLSCTKNLGNAVLAQQSDTMSAIQALRAKAKASGAF